MPRATCGRKPAGHDPGGAQPFSYAFGEVALERIRDIHASKRRVYLRVRDILALAADVGQVAAGGRVTKISSIGIAGDNDFGTATGSHSHGVRFN
jgi:hypothetical protein